MDDGAPCEISADGETAAVVFVDMAGFTALTEALGDHRAADVAEEFAAMSRSLLQPGGLLVKTIGDAVFVTTPDADAAVVFVRRLFTETRARGGFPVLRGGIAFGPVVRSRIDTYGATVNLAARLAAFARPGQTVVTRDVAAVARAQGLTVTELGATTLRNVAEPVDVFVVEDPAGCQFADVDPVCRTRLDDGTTVREIAHGATVYRFCSARCADRFARGVPASALVDWCENAHP